MYQADTLSQASEKEEIIFMIALDMIEECGLNGVTTREVAKRAGISPSGLLYRFGTREAFLAGFASWLIEKDKLCWNSYREQLNACAAPEALPSLSLAIVTDRVQNHRNTVLAMWEFQQLASRSADFQPFLSIWRQSDADFWKEFLPKCGLATDMAEGWAGALLGCTRVGVMAAPDVTSQVWMDDIVTRLSERLQNRPPSRPGDSHARQQAESNLTTTYALPNVEDTTQSRIVKAASDIIMEDGCAALSHRAIAKRAGVSLSSTTHHFQSLNDILLAAFETIYASAREQAEKLPRENRTYTREAFTHDILPDLAGPQQIGRTGALAADDIMLCARRDSATQTLATALIALSGATTTRLLAGITNSDKTYDRLDAHIVRLCLSGAMCGAEPPEGLRSTPLVTDFLDALL